MKINCAVNCALCRIKLSDFAGAVSAASDALEMAGGDHVKALYMRAQAHRRSSSTKEAKADIKRVLKLDPKNKALLREARKIKEQAEKEKA